MLAPLTEPSLGPLADGPQDGLGHGTARHRLDHGRAGLRAAAGQAGRAHHGRARGAAGRPGRGRDAARGRRHAVPVGADVGADAPPVRHGRAGPQGLLSVGAVCRAHDAHARGRGGRGRGGGPAVRGRGVRLRGGVQGGGRGAAGAGQGRTGRIGALGCTGPPHCRAKAVAQAAHPAGQGGQQRQERARDHGAAQGDAQGRQEHHHGGRTAVRGVLPLAHKGAQHARTTAPLRLVQPPAGVRVL